MVLQFGYIIQLHIEQNAEINIFIRQYSQS